MLDQEVIQQSDSPRSSSTVLKLVGQDFHLNSCTATKIGRACEGSVQPSKSEKDAYSAKLPIDLMYGSGRTEEVPVPEHVAYSLVRDRCRTEHAQNGRRSYTM